ncbi:MAG: hypothetical protein JNM93_05020 [Bacteriovoracaceae bacterium]|nr:hypothetical protein [Bacteriovoracaceae bacterium]
MRLRIIFITLFIFNHLTMNSYSQTNKSEYEIETNAEIIALITNIQVLDNEILKTAKNFGKRELNNEWYSLNHSAAKDSISDHWYSSPFVYLSAHQQLTTTITIDLAIITLGCLAQSYIKPDADMWISFGVGLAGWSAVGSAAHYSPSFHLMLSNKTEKEIISKAESELLNASRLYAKNMAIIFELSPQDEKLVENWAFELAMDNYYQANLYVNESRYKEYDILSFLKENGIAVNRVEIIQAFAKAYLAYNNDMIRQENNLKKQAEINKKQKSEFEQKMHTLEALKQSIETRQAEVTDPAFNKQLDSLERKLKEIKENYEITQGAE